MANDSINNAPGFFDVHLYINPKTLKVAGVFAYTYMGLAVRENGDWTPARRAETRLDEFTRFINYKIDWDVDAKPVSTLAEDENLEEHPLIQAYDSNSITWEMIKKYCLLVHDENGENPELSLNK
jgi:hypothetical protein